MEHETGRKSKVCVGRLRSEFSIKAKLKLSEFLMVYFFRNTKKNAHMNMSHVLLAKAAYKDGC